MRGEAQTGGGCGKGECVTMVALRVCMMRDAVGREGTRLSWALRAKRWRRGVAGGRDWVEAGLGCQGRAALRHTKALTLPVWQPLACGTSTRAFLLNFARLASTVPYCAVPQCAVLRPLCRTAQMRIALARLLLGPAGQGGGGNGALLLLDEPTNHLDRCVPCARGCLHNTKQHMGSYPHLGT